MGTHFSVPALLLAAGLLAADEAPKPGKGDATPPAPGTLVVVDASGKEQLVRSWSFTAGTRRLAWLAPAPPPTGKDEPKKDSKAAPAGPMALVVRDERKIHFLAGVVTLVPVDRLRSVEFDNDAETMTVRSSTGDGKDDVVVLTGTTAYKNINKLNLEAEVDKGDAGIAAITYRGGVPRGIRAVRFPTPKVEPFKPGRPAVVVTLDRDVQQTHRVWDLQPLYTFPTGREALVPTLMFRKTLKLDVGRIRKIAVSSEDSDDTVWQVTQKDGEEATLTLLNTAPLDGQTATLAGLVGRVPGGYKLFPVRRISSITFDAAEEKEKEKKDADAEK